jgi:DNA-binding NarL/FixJ family response regulator
MSRRAYDPYYISANHRAIVELLATGMTTKEIAHELQRPYATVKGQINRLCTRMRVSGRVALIVAALKVGWIRLDEIELSYVE